MIKSMTGFAALTREGDAAAIVVTIRAVNHRHLDLQVRAPASLAARESRLRSLVQEHVARGRIELTVQVQRREAPGVEVELNAPFITALVGAMDRAREAGLVEGRLAPGDLLRFPQALTIRDRVEAAADADPVADAVEAAVAETLGELDRMRTREGQYLQADLDDRLAVIGDLIGRLEATAATGASDLRDRLAKRVDELRADLTADPGAIAQEIVRLVSRSDISEELVRLRGHVAHWMTLAGAAEPCGRKLDFLLQEMNREVNTLGAKAEGPGISELIVAAKAELEKLREQVQNVE